jgi:hypothetical protein
MLFDLIHTLLCQHKARAQANTPHTPEQPGSRTNTATSSTSDTIGRLSNTLYTPPRSFLPHSFAIDRW